MNEPEGQDNEEKSYRPFSSEQGDPNSSPQKPQAQFSFGKYSPIRVANNEIIAFEPKDSLEASQSAPSLNPLLQFSHSQPPIFPTSNNYAPQYNAQTHSYPQQRSSNGHQARKVLFGLAKACTEAAPCIDLRPHSNIKELEKHMIEIDRNLQKLEETTRKLGDPNRIATKKKETSEELLGKIDSMLLSEIRRCLEKFMTDEASDYQGSAFALEISPLEKILQPNIFKRFFYAMKFGISEGATPFKKQNRIYNMPTILRLPIECILQTDFASLEESLNTKPVILEQWLNHYPLMKLFSVCIVIGEYLYRHKKGKQNSLALLFANHLPENVLTKCEDAFLLARGLNTLTTIKPDNNLLAAYAENNLAQESIFHNPLTLKLAEIIEYVIQHRGSLPSGSRPYLISTSLPHILQGKGDAASYIFKKVQSLSHKATVGSLGYITLKLLKNRQRGAT